MYQNKNIQAKVIDIEMEIAYIFYSNTYSIAYFNLVVRGDVIECTLKFDPIFIPIIEQCNLITLYKMINHTQLNKNA